MDTSTSAAPALASYEQLYVPTQTHFTRDGHQVVLAAEQLVSETDLTSDEISSLYALGLLRLATDAELAVVRDRQQRAGAAESARDRREAARAKAERQLPAAADAERVATCAVVEASTALRRLQLAAAGSGDERGDAIAAIPEAERALAGARELAAETKAAHDELLVAAAHDGDAARQALRDRAR